jgi:hypothetical protein
MKLSSRSIGEIVELFGHYYLESNDMEEERISLRSPPNSRLLNALPFAEMHNHEPEPETRKIYCDTAYAMFENFARAEVVPFEFLVNIVPIARFEDRNGGNIANFNWENRMGYVE